MPWSTPPSARQHIMYVVLSSAEGILLHYHIPLYGEEEGIYGAISSYILLIVGSWSTVCGAQQATPSARDAEYVLSMLYTILPYTSIHHIMGTEGVCILVYMPSILPLWA